MIGTTQYRKDSCQVPKHAYYFNSKQYFGGVITNVFFKEQVSIEVKIQVSLVYLGLKSRSTNCWKI